MENLTMVLLLHLLISHWYNFTKKNSFLVYYFKDALIIKWYYEWCYCPVLVTPVTYKNRNIDYLFKKIFFTQFPKYVWKT